MTVKDIYKFINSQAPFEAAEDFDNCGLLVGSKRQEVTGCVIALDVTRAVAELAIKSKAELIVTHHPVIFNPLKSVTDNDIVYHLVNHGISVISAHTNLDKAEGGVNDVLCERLGISDASILEGTDGVCRIGKLPAPMKASELGSLVKERLSSKSVAVTCHDNIISSVVISSGAGDSYFRRMLSSPADAYITGEVRHDAMIDAISKGVTLITAGHYYTEAPVLYRLGEALQNAFKTVQFYLYDKFPVKFIH